MTRPTFDSRTHMSPGIDAAHGAQSGIFARAAIRRVLTRPDSTLAQPSLEVDPRDRATVTLADVLVAMMYASPGCFGLTAPQVGETARVLCVDVTGHSEARSCAGLVVLANPRIIQRAGNVAMLESCMSVPHLTGTVARAAAVTVEGVLPGTSRVVRVAADGIEARCLLHAIDHLDGYLFTDRMLEASADLGSHKWYT